MMAGRFKVETVFKAVDRVTKPITRMQNRVGKFTRSMKSGLKGINRTFGKMASGIKRGGIVIAASLAVVAAGMLNIINIGADFEQTIVNAAAKFPGAIRAGTEEFKKLQIAAREIGKTTEFTALESAKALDFLAMAGFNARQAIAALPGVVDLATVSQTDLGTATDIATDSLGAFGLMTKDAVQLGKNLARINDSIAKTTTTANTNVEQLFEAIKEGAPVATTAGASLETFNALIGEMANAGIKGSRAGTTIKNVFTRLAESGGVVAATLKRMNVRVEDSEGNFRDIFDIFEDLNKSLEGLGTAEKTRIVKNIFGKIPLAGVNVLLKTGSDRLREYRTELENAAGASSNMADIMRSTVRGSINALKSSIEGVKITIFSMNKGPLKNAIDGMTDWVRANEQLIATKITGFLSKIINNYESIVKWVKIIGAGLAIFLSLAVILKSLIVIMTVLNLVMNLNPVGLIILGITALIAIVASVIIWWDKLKAVFLGLPGPVKKALAVLFLPITMLILGAKLIKDNWEPIKKFFIDLWADIVKVFEIAIAGITRAIDAVKGAISSVTGAVGGAISGVGSFLGFGDDDESEPQTTSRLEKVIEVGKDSNVNATAGAEILIRDDSGRAEITKETKAKNIKIDLQTSGAF